MSMTPIRIRAMDENWKANDSLNPISRSLCQSVLNKLPKK